MYQCIPAPLFKIYLKQLNQINELGVNSNNFMIFPFKNSVGKDQSGQQAKYVSVAFPVRQNQLKFSLLNVAGCIIYCAFNDISKYIDFCAHVLRYGHNFQRCILTRLCDFVPPVNKKAMRNLLIL